MSFKVWFLCVIAIAGIATTVAGPMWSRSKTTEEADMFVDGEMIHEKKEIEKNCRHIKTTTTLPDGSSSTSDSDFNSGVEIIQVSNDTSVCFVRFISDDERRQAASCMQGLVKNEGGGQPDSEEQQLEEGGDVPAEFLSPEQRLLCAGKRIVSVEPASSEGGDANREKRACGYYILRVVWRECYSNGYCQYYVRYYLVYSCK